MSGYDQGGTAADPINRESAGPVELGRDGCRGESDRDNLKKNN
jgi:hypothetical protein